MPKFHILITGKMGSGKTTLAKEVARMLPAKFPGKKIRVHLAKMAGPLYELEYITRAWINSKATPLYRVGKKQRDILQFFGEWCRNNVNEDFWVDLALQAGDKVRPKKGVLDIWIYDDIRYPNEIDALALFSDGHLIVRCTAPKNVRKERAGRTWAEKEHPSETLLDNAEYDVLCDTYRETLGYSVDKVVQHAWVSMSQFRDMD